MISFTQIFKEMMAERTRLLLTILAIAWGSATISGLLAVGEGMRLGFGQAISSAGNNLMIAIAGQTSKNFHGLGQGSQITFTDQDILAMKKIPGVKHVAPWQSFAADLVYGDKIEYANPIATTPDEALLRNLLLDQRGRFINQRDIIEKRRVIVLGNEIAKKLFSTKPALGQMVLLGGLSFQVVGVLQPKTQFDMLNGPDSLKVWIPISTYQMLTNTDGYQYLFIEPNSVDNTKLEILVRRAITNFHHASQDDKSVIHFVDIGKFQKQARVFFLGMQIFLGVVGGITLLVAAMGIANVMYFSVVRATRDIGIQMAVGAKTYHIMLRYLIESLIATMLGGIIGIGLIIMILTLVSHVPFHVPIPINIRPVLSWNILLTVIIILGFIGLLAGILPARKAAQIDPAVALRYE